MGQYYLVVNVDKRQFLHPHCFSDGLKLMEFGASGCGTMAGLAILLADGNGRGGGDCRVKADPYKLIGSWAGDRIVVTGDYADNGKLYHTAPDDDQPKDESGNPLNLYSYARVAFCDISEPVRELLVQDGTMQGARDLASEDKFDPGHRYAPKGPQIEIPEPEAPAPTPEDDPLAGF